jgi:hypothetical protein
VFAAQRRENVHELARVVGDVRLQRGHARRAVRLHGGQAAEHRAVAGQRGGVGAGDAAAATAAAARRAGARRRAAAGSTDAATERNLHGGLGRSRRARGRCARTCAN